MFDTVAGGTTPPSIERFYDRELVLPEGIRAPWEALCDDTGLPRVTTAWSLILCNWQVGVQGG